MIHLNKNDLVYDLKKIILVMMDILYSMQEIPIHL
jgi:hypothetical protein